MIESILRIIGSLGVWAYLLIGFVVTAEAGLFFGFILPGETVAIFGGFLAEQHQLNLGWLIALVFAGSVIGNLIGFEFGRRLKRPWLLRHGGRFGLRASHLKHIETFFERHGGKAVLLGRLSPLLRAGVPFVAGASNLEYRVFVVYTVIGGLIWSIGSVMIGYLAGESWPLVAHWIGRIGLGIVALAAVLAAVAAAHYRMRKWRYEKSSDRESHAEE